MTTTPTTTEPAPPRRRRHWVRRTLIALAAVPVLLVGAVVLYVQFAPVPAPLTLPAEAGKPIGVLAGTWDVTTGSAAGFRLDQTVLFASGDVVQRTTSVSGRLTTTATVVTAATFTVDLTTLTDDGTAAGTRTPQVGISLDTAKHPDATITLTAQVTVDPAIDSGATVTIATRADLTLRGQTHPVALTLTARRDGALLRAAGSIPVTFSTWDIPNPEGYGPLGSLADHGIAEFLLVLQRTD
jgi:polyisoprenoid-binding protein YceI